jgi:hypothetical protein
VGINTGEVPQGYSLAVKGKVIAEGMKVQYQTAWPDYVFDPGYSLPPLEYTKEFIKEHGHLPGVPSAKDVRANGVDVGEMNAILLKKIEELTLHVLALQEELRKVKSGKP